MAPHSADTTPAAPMAALSEEELIVLANRLLRTLGRVQREGAALSGACQAEHAEIEGRYGMLFDKLDLEKRSVERELENVAQYLPLYGKRSRNLPAGTISFRKVAQRFEATDKKALIAALFPLAEESGHLNAIFPSKREFSWSAALEHLEAVEVEREGNKALVVKYHGKEVPGVAVVPAEPNRVSFKPDLTDLVARMADGNVIPEEETA